MAEPILKRERVRDYLLELIETHPPGAPIPAERVLCARLSVSRPTLRSAVDELVNTGLLVRQHGRGTFV
ncbi:GntR family transcriptional regulator, partial [Saccharothrix sp. MB29]|nr:GntR family transcriptional regulator [Saccharothrix sp. MB29]